MDDMVDDMETWRASSDVVRASGDMRWPIPVNSDSLRCGGVRVWASLVGLGPEWFVDLCSWPDISMVSFNVCVPLPLFIF